MLRTNTYPLVQCAVLLNPSLPFSHDCAKGTDGEVVRNVGNEEIMKMIILFDQLVTVLHKKESAQSASFPSECSRRKLHYQIVLYYNNKITLMSADLNIAHCFYLARRAC